MKFAKESGDHAHLGAKGNLPARSNASLPSEYRAFDAPWHAHLFSLTVHLSESGCFSWQEWTIQLGAELRESENLKAGNGGDFYYEAWLRALEHLLLRLNYTARDELDRIRDLWKSAHASTPHGQPVKLDQDNE